MKRKLFIAALLACGLLFGCAQGSVAPDQPQSGKTITVDLSGYTIVRPESGGQEETDAALLLRRSMKESYGRDIAIATDFLNKRTNEQPGEFEILVGSTNREESVSLAGDLAPKDFAIDFTKDRLVILGGSVQATRSAVDYFISNYCVDGGVTISKGESYIYRFRYPEISVAGKKLSELALKTSEGVPKELAAALGDGIYSELNVKLADSGERSVQLVIDRNLDPGEATISVKNGDLMLTASSSAGLERCVSDFIGFISSPAELAEGFSRNAAANIPLIGEFESAENRYFTGVTDKDPLTYRPGETATIEIRLKADGENASCAKFSYSIAADDGSSSQGVVSGADGGLTLTATCSKPGAVRFKVTACDENGKAIEGVDAFDGGAIFGFDEILQASEEPTDYDEFWANQISELEKIEPKALKLEKVESGNSSYDIYDISVDMGDDDPVRGYLTIPSGAKAGTLAAKMQFQGYGVRSAAPTCFPGYITFTVCTHSIDQGMDDEYYENLLKGELKSYGFRADENNDPETVYFRKIILRDLQAARYLMASEYWNGTDFEVSGGSQGAFQSAAIAGLMPDKVTKCALSIPWLCDLGGVRGGRMTGWRPTYTDAILYYDTVSFARRIKCPVTVTAGLGDYTCPPSGVVSLYNAMSCKKSITFIQNKTHGYTPPEKLEYTK